MDNYSLTAHDPILGFWCLLIVSPWAWGPKKQNLVQQAISYPTLYRVCFQVKVRPCNPIFIWNTCDQSELKTNTVTVQSLKEIIYSLCKQTKKKKESQRKEKKRLPQHQRGIRFFCLFPPFSSLQQQAFFFLCFVFSFQLQQGGWRHLLHGPFLFFFSFACMQTAPNPLPNFSKVADATLLFFSFFFVLTFLLLFLGGCFLFFFYFFLCLLVTIVVW